MHKISKTFIPITISLYATLILSLCAPPCVAKEEIKEAAIVNIDILVLPIVVDEPVKATVNKPKKLVIKKVKIKKKKVKKEMQMYESDIKLIALVTMAEAEGECEKGKRLVIDTILNRVDSKHFPNTVRKVIYQPHQFSSMWDGRAKRCEVRKDICKLVKEELECRTNYKVMFFTAGGYGKYGRHMFQVENHYFSSMIRRG